MFPFDLLVDDARTQTQTQLTSTTWSLSYIGQDGGDILWPDLKLLFHHLEISDIWWPNFKLVSPPS